MPVQQPGGLDSGEAGQVHDLHAGVYGRHRRVPYREQHRDRVGHEAAGREQQRLHGPLVEPLQIVDHAQQRGVLGQHDGVGGTYSGPPSRLVTVSSVGHGGPSRSTRRHSSPKRLPCGNWSPSSQRHAATIAITSCRHSSSSPWSTPG